MFNIEWRFLFPLLPLLRRNGNKFWIIQDAVISLPLGNYIQFAPLQLFWQQLVPTKQYPTEVNIAHEDVGCSVSTRNVWHWCMNICHTRLSSLISVFHLLSGATESYLCQIFRSIKLTTSRMLVSFFCTGSKNKHINRQGEQMQQTVKKGRSLYLYIAKKSQKHTHTQTCLFSIILPHLIRMS